MAAVLARDIFKTFGETPAVDGITLTVADGEFMVLLGPSGCGKTTFLRIVCGLERQTSGDLIIGGSVVNDTPPRARGVAMMFQSYGLYPHYTVRNNIAFPLRTQRIPRKEIDGKVEWASRLLGIDRLLDRRPRQLSGGERQRVALARALVREPTALLLDEPLSNLDAKLRASARLDIKQFQQRIGVTTIYVTHDQVEAMGMGDRIAVIDHGRIRQVGTPTEIYDEPADRFVATFVGTPPMNLLARGGGCLGFRPENFLPRDMIDGGHGGITEFSFRVDRSEYLGSERIVYGVIDGFDTQVITARLPPAHVAEESIRPGEWHPFAVRNSALRYFDNDGKRTSRH
ncbi:ABC transporter ATP-binding protein [Bradyrhizobium sp.]|uniref:ABC transporter ATP-binding protein n=1 Tax=Bradyrhizobium sp. TaxID=376 RepID=UPI002387A67F|nr:ABC transporter ATP-binding protein [Bradyrhizobium sp.]MDE2378238.1 ABC transporter ATP-binding protein [Bradyrhizobium sp.]